MELLGAYKNGNYTTYLMTDGTKIRKTNDDEFVPAYAENMDVKISNYCDMNCPYCHEGSSTSGKHGDIMNQKFIDSLHPYQELAIGGGNALSHPDLIPFLQKLKEKKIIANMTVNQIHFETNQDLIKKLVEENLIYGLGVSLVSPTQKFIETIKKYPNAVIHVINGVFSVDDLMNLQNNNLKILILGYKELRRGNDYLNKNHIIVNNRKRWLKGVLPEIIDRFNTISFDNLAIEQLDVKRLTSDEELEQFYMGDDGTSTFYVDMVEQKFAKSSTAPMDKRYDLLGSVDEMFNVIRDNERNK